MINRYVAVYEQDLIEAAHEVIISIPGITREKKIVGEFDPSSS